MPRMRHGWQRALPLLTAVLIVLSACKGTKPPEPASEVSSQKICDCPKEATKGQDDGMGFLKDALFPRDWKEEDKQAALKTVRNYRQGFFAGPGGSWGSCQFQIGEEVFAKILADKEARATKKEFVFRTDVPPEAFRNWFDTPAMGLFQNKKGVLETCQLSWWGAAKHPGEYFRSWERTTQPPLWSVVVKVCPAEKGTRWVFFRCTAE